jgi:hypothetical protein
MAALANGVWCNAYVGKAAGKTERPGVCGRRNMRGIGVRCGIGVRAVFVVLGKFGVLWGRRRERRSARANFDWRQESSRQAAEPRTEIAGIQSRQLEIHRMPDARHEDEPAIGHRLSHHPEVRRRDPAVPFTPED